MHVAHYILAVMSPACVTGWLNVKATIEWHVDTFTSSVCCGLFLSQTGAESVQSLLGYKRLTYSLGWLNWDTCSGYKKCFWCFPETFFVSRLQILSHATMFRRWLNWEIFRPYSVCTGSTWQCCHMYPSLARSLYIFKWTKTVNKSLDKTKK